eukprot:gene338-362_t
MATINPEDIEWDDSIDPNGYSGTFRWKKSKVLPQMPSFSMTIPSSNNQNNKQHTLPFLFQEGKGGWKDYFISRASSSSMNTLSMLNYAHSDLSLIDCLSFPLSIVHFLSSVDLGLKYDIDNQYEKIRIVCIGCSEKAEERVLRETNCFHELVWCLPHFLEIELWLVGPEISTTTTTTTTTSGSSTTSSNDFLSDYEIKDEEGISHKMSNHLFQGNVTSFIRTHPECLQGSTVMIGFNCGFGNFENPLPRKYDLFLSWLRDLIFLTGSQLPLGFFCANDYADLKGEVAIMHNLLGAQFINHPSENPYSFASTLIPPGAKVETQYSRGNSFFYAVQGSVSNRRSPLLRRSDLGPSLIPLLLSCLSGDDQTSSINVQRGSLTLQVHAHPVDNTAATIAAITIDPERKQQDVFPVEEIRKNNEDVRATTTAESAESHISHLVEKETLNVDQHLDGNTLIVQISLAHSEYNKTSLRQASLDLHSSGTFLRLNHAGHVHTINLHQPVIASTALSLTASYMKKSNKLKLKLVIA